jgi:thiol-disulfide isomerase/thioredoxin
MKLVSRNCAVHPLQHLKTGVSAFLLGITFACAAPIAGGADLPAPELSHELTRLDTPVSAPDFTLENMDGEKISLNDFHGQVVMLNFWATWCPPCRREIPSMESIYQDLGKDGFVVLAVNEFEDPDHVFAYTGQLSVDPTFPVLFDRDSSVSQLYGVKGLPTTVLIDKQGKMVYRAVGGRDFDHAEVRDIVRSLLAR